MTSPALAAAALQLGAYRTQVRPQGTGTRGAGVFEAQPQPVADGRDAPGARRTVVRSTEAVRIELSAAARTALLELQTLAEPPGTPKSPPGALPGARDTAAGPAPTRVWSSPPYIAPGGRLNLSV